MNHLTDALLAVAILATLAAIAYVWQAGRAQRLASELLRTDVQNLRAAILQEVSRLRDNWVHHDTLVGRARFEAGYFGVVQAKAGERVFVNNRNQGSELRCVFEGTCSEDCALILAGSQVFMVDRYMQKQLALQLSTTIRELLEAATRKTDGA